MRASAASLTAAPAGATLGLFQRIGEHQRDEQQRPLAVMPARGAQRSGPALVKHLAQHPHARFAAVWQ